MDKLFKFFGKSKPKAEKKEPDARNINAVIMNNNKSEIKVEYDHVVEGNVNSSNMEQGLRIKFENPNLPATESTHYENNSQHTTDNNSETFNHHDITQYSLTTPSHDDPKADDVVLVNPGIKETPNKAEGFYYKKYINQIHKLKLSNPILIEREKMKVNFDSEVMDYLVNDMTLLFKERQSIIDTNQAEILKEIQESKELISILSDMHNDATLNYNMEFIKKQKKFMNEIDYLEVVVNTLNLEADNLTALMNKIENTLDIYEEDNS